MNNSNVTSLPCGRIFFCKRLDKDYLPLLSLTFGVLRQVLSSLTHFLPKESTHQYTRRGDDGETIH